MNIERLSFCKMSIRCLKQYERDILTFKIEDINRIFDEITYNMNEYEKSKIEDKLSALYQSDKKNALNYLKSILQKNIKNRIDFYHNQLK